MTQIKTHSRISIVIPVYNEADHLGACLGAIATQAQPPYEVIVVDNNSTDGTAVIAQRFAFVKLLCEPRQGVVHARNRGFNAARGDIIGRIDADTVLPNNWTALVTEIFSQNEVDAVSGSVNYYDLPYADISSKLDIFFRQRIANGMRDEVFLYGANMALRRDVWLKTRDQVCSGGGLHEDFDLAIHAYDSGAKIVFDRRLRAGISLRRVDASAREFWQYAMLSPRTYARHGRTSQRYMYPAIVLVVSFYWFIKLLHMGYDPETAGFSWRHMLAYATQGRVNPATFVD